MRKITILLFAVIVFASCEKESSQTVNVKFNVSGVPVKAEKLKSDEVFNVMTHNIYGSGNLLLVSDKQSFDEYALISFSEGSIESESVGLAEGLWRIQYELRDENRAVSGSRDITTMIHRQLNYSFENGQYLKSYFVKDLGYQSITINSPEFNIELVPDSDCVAIYDPQDLMESYYWSNTPGIRHSVIDNWKHYDNGVKTYYTRFTRWDVINLVLSNGSEVRLNLTGYARETVEDNRNPIVLVPMLFKASIEQEAGINLKVKIESFNEITIAL